MIPTLVSFTARPDFEREREAMGVAAGAGFAGAGALGLISVLMPVPGSMDVSAIAALALAAFLGGGAVLLARERLPLWAFHVLTLAGIVMITASIELNGDPSANNELFYLYAAGFTFYFFAWTEASGYALVSFVAYGWVEGRIAAGAVEPTNLLILAGGTVMLGTMLRFVGGNSRGLLAELETQATTDELTGLLNRRGLQRLADAEMARALRSGRPFSLLIGDLDHFKAVNDKLGHMGGDMALQRVAAGFGAERRAIDSAARIGGEEFAVLMPETDKDDALIAAERFRRSIRSKFRGRPVELTMSIGVATYPFDGESWEQLLDSADTALYQAKDGGRNHVVAFDGDRSGVVT